MKRRQFSLSNKSNQSGFTLVEMSIVLVIIGLILGALSIGTDLQRDAEFSKIKQKFLDQWVQGYNTHYQRTGMVVGDNPEAPTLIANGLSLGSNVEIGGSNNDSITVDPICGDSTPSLLDEMKNLGITLPAGRGENAQDNYVYLDANGHNQMLKVCFGWNKPGTESGTGNVMIIEGVTPDLAQYIDQTIDGQLNASTGRIREAGVKKGTLAWSADFSAGEDVAVTPLTIHYKMSQ